MTLDLREKFKQMRVEAGISQQELADRWGYPSRGSISNIECGNNNMKITQKELDALAYVIQQKEGGKSKRKWK